MSNFSFGQIIILLLILLLLFGDVPKIIYRIKNNISQQQNVDKSTKKNRKKGT